MAPARKRILCVSYDPVLLRTRQMLLEEAGFDVTSAPEFWSALEHCWNHPKFDLIVMDHPIPHQDTTALVATLRAKSCNAPILSVRLHSDPPLPEADFCVDSSDGPAALVAAVKSAVTRKAKAAPD